MEINGLTAGYFDERLRTLEEQGKTAMLIAKVKSPPTPLFQMGEKGEISSSGKGEILGVIAVADTLKESSVAAIKALKKEGVEVIMLTGDNERTARAIAGQAGISGSVKIGNRVMVGGQAGLAGHLEVEDGIILGARTGVAGNLRSSESAVWSGTPAVPHSAWLRFSALLPRLPELFRRVKKLEEGKNPKGEE